MSFWDFVKLNILLIIFLFLIYPLDFEYVTPNMTGGPSLPRTMDPGSSPGVTNRVNLAMLFVCPPGLAISLSSRTSYFSVIPDQIRDPLRTAGACKGQH